ncbi:hypothetical protein PR048_018262 [Dryococelus australis]|uniref:Uncharacterized protein n=1 Tax=Dryococelus australis TaxID=614101 RepID=A0ABQ9HBT0_9NEOP|nr:hypothetical protein PR048_018262 [Dryococelus australis]
MSDNGGASRNLTRHVIGRRERYAARGFVVYTMHVPVRTAFRRAHRWGNFDGSKRERKLSTVGGRCYAGCYLGEFSRACPGITAVWTNVDRASTPFRNNSRLLAAVDISLMWRRPNVVRRGRPFAATPYPTVVLHIPRGVAMFTMCQGRSLDNYTYWLPGGGRAATQHCNAMFYATYLSYLKPRGINHKTFSSLGAEVAERLSLLASHHGEPGSIASRVAHGLSYVGIMPDDTAVAILLASHHGHGESDSTAGGVNDTDIRIWETRQALLLAKNNQTHQTREDFQRFDSKGVKELRTDYTNVAGKDGQRVYLKAMPRKVTETILKPRQRWGGGKKRLPPFPYVKVPAGNLTHLGLERDEWSEYYTTVVPIKQFTTILNVVVRNRLNLIVVAAGKM